MLVPTTSAPFASPRHNQTIAATINPQAKPMRSAVALSRRRFWRNQLRVGACTCNAWIVSVMDCMLTLSFKPSTIVRKNATTRLLASVYSNAPARNAQAVPAATVVSSHGKTITKNAPGRRAANLREPNTERFENIFVRRRRMVLLAFTRFQHLFRKQTDIDDADDPPFFIDDRKREKFVEHKKFACFQNRRTRGNGDDSADHDFVEPFFQRRREQTARRQNADKFFVGIDGEEINNALAYALAPDAFERSGHIHFRIKQRKIFARVFDNERIKIRTGGRFAHRSILRGERCLCRGE